MEYKNLTEENLVLMAQEGDSMALETLIKGFQGFLNYICDKYYLKGGDKDDLIQEANIGLLEAIEAYQIDSGKKFRNFAFLCVKRELDSCILKYNRKKHSILNDAIPIFTHADKEEERTGYSYQVSVDRLIKDNTPSPEALIVEKESLSELLSCINSILSDLEREVLFLRITGLSYSEITTKLNLQTKSVDNAVQRIRRKITLGKIRSA
ncbi:MAG: sigma-70 family RNA polymerase sigma factor [Clostridia bacterium]|nr:sigma-70 family RNA polymerase sigma factor [Clostridia bacterium]